MIKLIPGRRHFVHRYRWSHDDKRQQFKRALKDGVVRIVERTRDGWLYEVVA